LVDWQSGHHRCPSGTLRASRSWRPCAAAFARLYFLWRSARHGRQ